MKWQSISEQIDRSRNRIYSSYICNPQTYLLAFQSMNHGISSTVASSIDALNFDSMCTLYRFRCYCRNYIFHRLQHHMHRHAPIRIYKNSMKNVFVNIDFPLCFFVTWQWHFLHGSLKSSAPRKCPKMHASHRSSVVWLWHRRHNASLIGPCFIVSSNSLRCIFLMVLLESRSTQISLWPWQ